MIENVDVTFFRKVLELDNYEEFLNFTTELMELMNNITYDDFLVFRDSIFNQLRNNNYNFQNIDDVIREELNRSYDTTILKLNSYMNYLSHNKKINLNDRIDVLKYYGDIKNIDERICAYSNISNIDCVELQDVLNYLMMISKVGKKDDIALSIILDRISKEESESYYEQLIEKMKKFCQKYEDVINELHNKKLINELFKYFQLAIIGWSKEYNMFQQMIEYLKVNNLKKDKIYTILKKVEELQINQVNISIEREVKGEIHNIGLSKFKKAYYKKETIENGYVGTYIYTDGDKNWLVKTGSAHYENNFEDTYKVEISKFKYVLVNDKLIDRCDDCDGPFFGPYLSIISKLQINDFDMDISTLPSYEELHSFKIKFQVDFIKVEERTKSADTILQIESTIRDVKKLLGKLTKLQEKLQFVKDSKEYTDVFSQINYLENLIGQMEDMKSCVSEEYLKQGITELDKLKELKKKK